MKQFDYKEKYKEVMENLEKEKAMVLATSDGDKVAARAVWFVPYESSIYFFTSKSYSKYKQIVKNPNVALCINNIQIQGVAYIKGHPALEENKPVLEHWIKRRGNKYVNNKSSVFIEVKIDKIQAWANGGREYIDINEKTAYRVG
jgi:general stress protein 26